jgi:hypothetical protein
MFPAIHTLLFGHDYTLLQTRRLIMEHEGCTTSDAMRLSDVEQILASRPVQLLVICHSVSCDEVDQVLRLANELQPNMQTIVLKSGFSFCEFYRDRKSVDVSLGPASFIHEVRLRLGKLYPPSSSTHRRDHTALAPSRVSVDSD